MADNKNMGVIGIIISVFVMLIIGAVLVTITSTQVNDITGLDYSSDSQALTMLTNNSVSPYVTYTVVNAPTGWKAQSAADGGCALTNFVLANSTGTALTLTTDYTVDLQYGTYVLKDTTATQGYAALENVTVASYNSCPDNYQSGFGNTVINLIPGFFALALLVSVAFLIFWILRREGVDI